MRFLSILLLAAAVLAALSRPPGIPFAKHELDAGANEACAFADINGDGLGDIVWSQAPVNDTLRVRAQLARPAGGYGAPVTLYSQWDTVAYEQPEGGDFRVFRDPAGHTFCLVFDV